MALSTNKQKKKGTQGWNVGGLDVQIIVGGVWLHPVLSKNTGEHQEHGNTRNTINMGTPGTLEHWNTWNIRNCGETRDGCLWLFPFSFGFSPEVEVSRRLLQGSK